MSTSPLDNLYTRIMKDELTLDELKKDLRSGKFSEDDLSDKLRGEAAAAAAEAVLELCKKLGATPAIIDDKGEDPEKKKERYISKILGKVNGRGASGGGKKKNKTKKKKKKKNKTKKKNKKKDKTKKKRVKSKSKSKSKSKKKKNSYEEETEDLIFACSDASKKLGGPVDLFVSKDKGNTWERGRDMVDYHRKINKNPDFKSYWVSLGC